MDGGHPDRKAIELAVQLWQYQANGSGSTGLGRDHRLRGGTGPAQVLVIDIGEHLIVGIGVHRGHQA